jgi:hypothetical protein
MAQKVTITTEESVALRPLLESAVRTELRMLDLGLERTDERLRRFEERFGMNSDEFMRRYRTGQIEESLDTIEWAGEVETREILKGQRKAL